jgi:alkanesulfonate monooxygenase SsuD/methylene tetrahydromethanopterin reductase-like flavin-dependent oxidoreductase (luciferase family)
MGPFGATPRSVTACQRTWQDRMERQPGRFMSTIYPAAIRDAADALGSFLQADGRLALRRSSNASSSAGRRLAWVAATRRIKGRTPARSRGKRERLDKRLWMDAALLTGASGHSTSLVGTPQQVAEALCDYYDLAHRVPDPGIQPTGRQHRVWSGFAAADQTTNHRTNRRPRRMRH